MASLQYIDGPYVGDADELEAYERRGCDTPYCDHPTLQSQVFYEFDKAMYHAKTAMLVQGWQAVWISIIARTINTLLRFIMSGEDMINERFFHIPINCGYGENAKEKKYLG